MKKTIVESNIELKELKTLSRLSIRLSFGAQPFELAVDQYAPEETGTYCFANQKTTLGTSPQTDQNIY